MFSCNSMMITELCFYCWVFYGYMSNFWESSRNSIHKRVLHNLQYFATVRVKDFLTSRLSCWAEEFEFCRCSIVTYPVVLKVQLCNAGLRRLLETILHCEGVGRYLWYGRYWSWNLYGLKDIFKHKRLLFYQAAFEEILFNLILQGLWK